MCTERDRERENTRGEKRASQKGHKQRGTQSPLGLEEIEILFFGLNKKDQTALERG